MHICLAPLLNLELSLLADRMMDYRVNGRIDMEVEIVVECCIRCRPGLLTWEARGPPFLGQVHITEIKDAIDGKIVTIGMACITIWALFGDDLRLVATTKEADDAFYITFFICFLLFLIELIL